MSDLITGVLEIATGVGIIAFWILFYSTDMMKPKNPPEGYMSHERAFVFPDTLTSIALIAAAILLFMKNPLGGSLSLVCSGALMFLGVIDLAYNLQTKLPGSSVSGTIQTMAINIWVLGFGLFLAIRFVGRV